MYRTFSLIASFLIFALSCKKPDTISPQIILNADTTAIHYRNTMYTDPGASVIDDHTCNLNGALVVENHVDVSHYGSYIVQYFAEDDEGNADSITRIVQIVLPKSDYYNLNYKASDSCSLSGTFTYTGLIQDCDCEGNNITVGNISNFGLSATFTLPISGYFNETITMDTTRFAVHFVGAGKMSSGADTIYWNYAVSDSINTDVCRSIWVKE